jgi:hypothetical protein
MVLLLGGETLTMASILPFLRVGSDSAFDDEATRVMGLAFEAACAELPDNNLSPLVRELLAERIIEAAKRGERDPQRLCSIAISAVGGERQTG